MGKHELSSIHSCGLSRREVLATMAGAGVAASPLLQGALAAPAALPDEPQDKWPLVRAAFVRPKEEYWLGWPGTAWDTKGYLEKSQKLTEQFAKELKVRVTFEPEPLYDDAAVDAFIAKIKQEKPAASLVFPMHMNRWKSVGKIADSGIKTIIFAPLGVCFTGHIQAISKKPGVYLASSPDYELGPVRFGLKMVRTAHDVQRSKVVVIRGKETKDQTLDPFGLKLRYIPRKRFPDTVNSIGETPEVLAMADAYTKAAKKVVEPSRADMISASKNYYAALKIMKEEGCQGITMDCLGLVTSREMTCPPCLAWAKLLDVGVPAICEADINAVMSHTLCCMLLDKPGFMQDPVPETVKNTFIGAHCVCPTRLNGYDQPAEPFNLRSHSESDVGVSVQVFWKPEQDVTIMQFVNPGGMILGKGKVIRNLDTPPCGGCRTSVELAIDAPADTRDTKGFHQLFIYGDHMRQFQAYGQMFGIKTDHI